MQIHRFAMSSLGLAGLVLCGCVGDNPDYCDATKPCPTGFTCDPQTHGCIPVGDSGADAMADVQAPDPDGQAGDSAGGTKDNGATCAKDGECKSGVCAEGVCCDNRCDSTCKSCKVSGKEGTCSLVLSGDDLKQDCVGTDTSCAGSCDGLGACLFPGSTTSCGTDACSGGKLTVHQCDGTGGCGATVQDCGGYACESAGAACKTACATKGDCTGTFTCINKVCTNTLADGQSCGTNNDACKSKKCVDGVCCATDCTGTCMACNVKSKEGTCSAVLSGQDPDTECAGKDALCAGSCNGGGKCTYPGASKQCKTDACSGSTLTKHACDGKGTCGSSSSSCGAYMCKATKDGCRASCTSNTHCVGKLCDVYSAATKNVCPASSLVCYVDAKVTGGNGTLAKPYAAISQCLATTKGYVSVADGTYNENLVLDAKKVQIVAVTEPGSVYGGGVPSVMLRPNKTQNGFELKNNAELYMQGFDVSTTVNNITLLNVDSSKATVMFCRFHDTPSSISQGCCIAAGNASVNVSESVANGCNIGIYVPFGYSSVALIRTRMNNNTSSGVIFEGDSTSEFSASQVEASNNGQDGIWLFGIPKVSIERATLQGNMGVGLLLSDCSNAWAANVLSSGNGSGVFWSGASCPGVCKTNTIQNVTIAHNTYNEISCGTASGVEKLNVNSSIIWDTSGTAVSGTACVFSYSDVYGGVAGSTNINLNPKFVDVSKGNYRLSDKVGGKSPCINVGDPGATNLPKVDLDGANRVVGIVDMGAYEAK